LSEPRAGIVLGHGYAQTKDALRAEATYLCERGGYVCLSIDYRTRGKSEGEPRGQVYPRDHVDDYRNAITYMSRRPEVDNPRIGIWGASLAGGLVLQVAAIDRRVRATVSQSPEVNGRRFLQYGKTTYEFDDLLSQLERDFVNRYEGGEGERIPYRPPGDPPVVDDPSNPNIVAWDTKYQPTLDPMILLSSLEKIIDFQPDSMIQHIAPRPLLIIANGGYDANEEWQFDAGHLLADIQEAFKGAGEPKKLVILPYNAYGLYNEPGRGEALAAALDFYQQYLPAKR
jgi:alpha-beta hydrolase superfamily lysophospholipase